MTAKVWPLALVGVLIGAGLAAAADVRGVLTRYDADKKELVIDARGPGVRGTSWTFRLASDAAITLGQEMGTTADLVPGKHVRVSYTERDGQRIATTVHVFAVLKTLQKLLDGLQPPAPQPAPVPAAPPVEQLPATPRPPGPVGKAPGLVEGQVGVLRRVAYTEREIILASAAADGKESYVVLAVPVDARVMRDGKETAFDTLKEGERATVRIESRNGKACATAIAVGQGGLPPQTRSAVPAAPNCFAEARRALAIADQVLEQLQGRLAPDR